jgi:hypothetical protein
VHEIKHDGYVLIGDGPAVHLFAACTLSTFWSSATTGSYPSCATSMKVGRKATRLQNRVTPFGDIVAIPQRGTFTGNRGIIHDPMIKTLLTKRWASKAWLVCSCEHDPSSRLSAGPPPDTRNITTGSMSSRATCLTPSNLP